MPVPNIRGSQGPVDVEKPVHALPVDGKKTNDTRSATQRFMEAAGAMADIMSEVALVAGDKSNKQIEWVAAINAAQTARMVNYPAGGRPEDQAARTVIDQQMQRMEASKTVVNDMLRASSTGMNALQSAILTVTRDAQDVTDMLRTLSSSIWNK